MQTKRTIFSSKILPYWLILPQLAVTLIFFVWPALQAVWQSFQREDAFGTSTEFVGLANYTAILHDPGYLNALIVTVVFSISVATLSIVIALVLAVAANSLLKSRSLYTTLLVWPYAVAPAVAGVLFWFMFNPTIGLIPYMLKGLGYHWDDRLNGTDAMILVVIAATWKQISYNFLFFLAGLQSIPKALIEAAAIDGAGPGKRFRDIIFPLLSPTTFFLLVVNVVYTMFDTFAVIHATTQGGPNQATNILVYKVFTDGFIGLDLGSSSAQSVVLMVIVIALTFIQFRFVERNVQY
jgi:sn-glycerol 3-phosphate transport system permease protein